MAKLVIERVSGIISRVRNFDVFVDGQSIGKVKNGETKEFTIPAGKHTLRTGISAFSGISPIIPFSINENETLHYTTRPNPVMIPLLIIIFIIAASSGASIAKGNMSALFIVLILLAIGGFLGYKYGVSLKQKLH